MKRWLIFAVIFLAPHIQFPGADQAYPARPSDIAILIAVILAICTAKSCKLESGKVVYAACICFAFSVISVVWGSYYLSSLQLDIITIGDGKLIYLAVAFQKLISLIICFLGFYLLANSRQINNMTMLRYWFYGLAFACAIHIMTYAIDWSVLIMRAGVSKEGNFGGSYYLLSFFLMLIASINNYKFGKVGVALSVVGIFLSQSTTSILILMALWAMYKLIVSPKLSKASRNWSLGSIALLGATGLFVSVMFGDVIVDKLFGVEITSSSFSRYDRLSSILSGLGMFEASPLLGVGIQGYSFALPMYTNDFLDAIFDWNSRRIANNVYVEILAEQGVVGLVTIGYLLYQIIRTSFVDFMGRNVFVAFGFLSVLISWMAFPTYTVSFHWLGFALLYRFALDNTLNKKNAA
ncbi:O-antigen ligase-related [Methylophilaceae bacterium]